MYSKMVGLNSKILQRALFCVMFSFAIYSLALPSSALAKAKHTQQSNPRYAALVVDANTGMVLHQENADKYRYPASLTKMMTLYLAFEAVKQGKLHMSDTVTISPFAASRPRMNMGFRAGQKISLQDTILSVVVRSANDSAVALAEQVSGSESAFVDKMNERAKTLGMLHTVFRNSSGLPNSEQKTTAYDLARLAIALRRDFPEYYPLFSRTDFTYNGKVYKGHNRITSNYPGCDGLKTGFVNASGFNLVSSAKRGDTKVVAVVLGGATAQSRDKQMIALLDRFLGKTKDAKMASNVEKDKFITVASQSVQKASPTKATKKYKTSSKAKASKNTVHKEQVKNTTKSKTQTASNKKTKTSVGQEVAGL